MNSGFKKPALFYANGPKVLNNSGKSHFATIDWIPAFAGMTGTYLHNQYDSLARPQTTTALFKLVMQLQSLIDLSHELFWETSELFDKTDLVYSPGLIDHDFRTGS
jgi:hypothetical protein